MSKSCPKIGENFVKLYAELQKLDHLTCSKLKFLRSSMNPLRDFFPPAAILGNFKMAATVMDY